MPDNRNLLSGKRKYLYGLPITITVNTLKCEADELVRILCSTDKANNNDN
jgi:hypothetical protein